MTNFDPAVTDFDPAVTDPNPAVTDSNPVNFRVTLTVRPSTFILSDFREPYFRVT